MMYDVIAQAATDISHGQRASFPFYGRMEPVTLRLKALRASANPRITVRAMADALGMPSSTYAAYEDPAKFKKPILPFDLAKRISEILTERGVDGDDVMSLAGLTPRHLRAQNPAEKEVLVVKSSVEAGVWREQIDWPEDEWGELEVGPLPTDVPRNSERFAIRMVGYSMDKIIPPNSDLECVRVRFGGMKPSVGDLVVAERQSHGLVEMTCKRLDRDEHGWLLRAESTRPEFSEIIRIGDPDPDVHTDDETRVVGIVLKAHLDLFGSRRRRAA